MTIMELCWGELRQEVRLRADEYGLDGCEYIRSSASKP